MKNKKKIRLLIDTVTIGSPGIFRLKHELILSIIKHCPESWEIILFQNKSHDQLSPVKGCYIENVKSPGFGWIGRWYWYNCILPNKIKQYKVDVCYSLSGILNRSISSLCGTIGTINNMLPFSTYQINHFSILSTSHLRLLILQRLYKKSAILSDSMILHSHHALKSISRFTGDISDKTFVVLTGIPKDLQLDPKNPPLHPYHRKPYLFYLSTIHWYKNHINLIKAYKKALSLSIEKNLPELIIAGYPVDKEYVNCIKKEIVKNNLNDHIKFLGAIPYEDIPAWIYHAAINVFPSTCETNSVIQSEILGMHGVMACSNIPPMPEVVGDAAEMFDPYEPDSIAKTIIYLLKNKKVCDKLRRRAAKRAGNLSWDICGKTIWKAAKKAYENFKLRNGNNK